MENRNKPHIEKLQWKNVRKAVEAVNKPLAKIIDNLDPSPEYALYKASYPFGCESVREGKLYLPNSEGTMLPLNNSNLPKEFGEQLSYNVETNPVSLILKNQFEIYLELADRSVILPTGLASPGNLISLGRVLHAQHGFLQPPFLWNISAGVRSLFMLPKISAAAGYKKLKRQFDIHVDEPPKSLLDHWEVFKEIGNNPNFGEMWTAEILYFGKKWFEHLDDKEWVYFSHYLYKVGWTTTEYYRNQFIWELIYSLIKKKRRLKPNPYVADTAKHLIAMGVGAAPGFGPAMSDIAGPISKIQRAFKDHYPIGDYAPIIMQPKLLDLQKKNDTVYYSLSCPIAIEFSPSTRIISNKITHLYEIKYLMEKYLEELAKDNFNIEGTLIKKLLSNVKFEYFHNDCDTYPGIRPVQEILQEDQLIASLCNNKRDVLSLNSPLINGCVCLINK